MSLVIPTREKQKLPEEFAYPLWPSKITELLADTPQRTDAELVFHWRDEFWASHWRQRIQQKGVVRLLTIKYTPDFSPYFPKWRIGIFSVPKEYVSAAQEILFGPAIEELVAKLKFHGLTPDYPVNEKISMYLAKADYDMSRLTPDQIDSPEPDARLAL